MKLVEGETLGDHVAHVADRGERLRIFERLCDPVSFAHARGVVHRDLKPDNVMVGSFGEVLVMDWGVAKLLRPMPEPMAVAGEPDEPTAAAGAKLARAQLATTPGPQPETVPRAETTTPGRAPTAPGTVVGTRGFMAPEQERGQPVDARADVYALGAILRWMLDRDVPRPLQAICARAMAEDPARRYEDARALALDVARYRDGLPVSAYRESPLERLGRWGHKYQTALLLVAAYLVMRALLAWWTRQRI
jgi:serine/threonine protein kinase